MFGWWNINKEAKINLVHITLEQNNKKINEHKFIKAPPKLNRSCRWYVQQLDEQPIKEGIFDENQRIKNDIDINVSFNFSQWPITYKQQ